MTVANTKENNSMHKYKKCYTHLIITLCIGKYILSRSYWL